MSTEPADLVLHALSIKGLASPERVMAFVPAESGPDAGNLLTDLQAQGMVRYRDGRRISGWMLTEEGRERHKTWFAGAQQETDLDALAAAYEGFLRSNSELKNLASRWQSLDPEDESSRNDAIDRLGAIHEAVSPSLQVAEQAASRFGGHRRRLERALERVRDGDHAYFTGATVDSYHTVWFECHEEFLTSLGRDRAREGSL